MRTTSVLPLLFAAFGLARAADNRLLFQIPAGESMAAFDAAFTSTCKTWYPALKGDSLVFQTALVQPGDFQGKNPDTKVKLVCSWRNPEGVTKTFTTDVAKSLGATKL